MVRVGGLPTVNVLCALCLALGASAASGSVWDLVTTSPRPKKSARQPSVLERGYGGSPVNRVVVTNIVEKPVEKVVTVEKVVEKPVAVEKIVTVDRPVTSVVERVIERTNVIERVIERTNVVEKVVYDRSVEMRLARDKTALERRGEDLSARNEELVRENAALNRELGEAKAFRERIERENPGKVRRLTTGRPARITARETTYDRKRGVAIFDGDVFVDDENYKIHAKRAFVFTEGTNDVRRIVAIGNVAMTNEARRAYGGKISYYRKDGMVVLYAGGGVPAEIRDESKAEDQVLRGSKIKFWIDREQIEVLDANISAPTRGMGLESLRR